MTEENKQNNKNVIIFVLTIVIFSLIVYIGSDIFNEEVENKAIKLCENNLKQVVDNCFNDTINSVSVSIENSLRTNGYVPFSVEGVTYKLEITEKLE